MESINYSEYIEKYIDGNMSGAELIWFEKELEGNAQLLKELHLRKEINTAIAETDVMELQAQLKDICTTKRKVTRTLSLRTCLSAAAVVLVAVSIITFNPFKRTYTNQELFNQYYEPYQASMSFRSTQPQIDRLLKDAYKNYREQHYESAIPLFEAAIEKDNTDMASVFYAGMSYMETEQYASANNKFTKVVEARPNLYMEQAEWYLALCYLITDNHQKALNQLTAIANSHSYYAQKAGEILNKMD